MTRRSSILDDALALHGLPVSVIPIAGNKKPPARFSWKPYQTQIADEADVRDWFDRRDDLGLAIILGAVSGGLYARDFDTKDAYRRWADSHTTLARSLPTVVTKRGRHVYGRFDAMKNQVFDDGELRSNGLYVVAPHSRHPDGGKYCWQVPITSLESIPILDPAEAGFTQKHAQVIEEGVTDQVDQSDQWFWSDLSSLIDGCLPQRPGTRNHCLFLLARSIRLHPIGSTIPVKKLRSLVQEWHRKSLPFIRTKDFTTSWSDFVIAHSNIDAEHQDAVGSALQRLSTEGLPDAANLYDSEAVQRLVGLCYQLSLSSADGVFFLSARKAASMVDADAMSISRYLKMLIVDGLLAVVQKGNCHRATRYRWIGEK